MKKAILISLFVGALLISGASVKAGLLDALSDTVKKATNTATSIGYGLLH